nr:MAG TPA: hypothetical protein [Caudoviricetes sp.]
MYNKSVISEIIRNLLIFAKRVVRSVPLVSLCNIFL